jgi:hypothetical protein
MTWATIYRPAEPTQHRAFIDLVHLLRGLLSCSFFSTSRFAGFGHTLHGRFQVTAGLYLLHEFAREEQHGILAT